MGPATLALAALIWHGSLDVASARAELGPWRMNESSWDFVDDPTVALDERGAAAVAWVDQASKDVFFRRFSADGKPVGARVNVSRTPKVFSWLPRIAIDPKGRILVLWQEIIFSGGGKHGGDILFARSEDGGATFSAPLNLSNSPAGDGKGRVSKEHWDNGSLDLAVGGDGTIYAAWTEFEGALWFSRSTDGGKTFSKVLRIADAKPTRAPALAVSKDAVYLAWTVGDDYKADLRVARSADRGASFGKPVMVDRGVAYSDAPKLAVDPRDALHLVWMESEHGLPGNRHQVRYSRSTDDGATFERSRDISGNGAGFPALSIDGRGNLYVLWERFADHPQFARGLALAVSGDGGRTFKAGEVPGSADASNGGTQGMLMRKLAVSRDGSIAIVNSSFKQNERSRVWLMRASAPRPKAP
jgi:hypothetical protein